MLGLGIFYGRRARKKSLSRVEASPLPRTWLSDDSSILTPEEIDKGFENFGSKTVWHIRLFGIRRHYTGRIREGKIDGIPFILLQKKLEAYDARPAIFRFLTRLFTPIETQRELLCYFAASELHRSTNILSKEVAQSILRQHQPRLRNTAFGRFLTRLPFFKQSNDENNNAIIQEILPMPIVKKVTLEERTTVNDYISQLSDTLVKTQRKLVQLKEKKEIKDNDYITELSKLESAGNQDNRRIKHKAALFFSSPQWSPDKETQQWCEIQKQNIEQVDAQFKQEIRCARSDYQRSVQKYEERALQLSEKIKPKFLEELQTEKPLAKKLADIHAYLDTIFPAAQRAMKAAPNHTYYRLAKQQLFQHLNQLLHLLYTLFHKQNGLFEQDIEEIKAIQQEIQKIEMLFQANQSSFADLSVLYGEDIIAHPEHSFFELAKKYFLLFKFGDNLQATLSHSIKSDELLNLKEQVISLEKNLEREFTVMTEFLEIGSFEQKEYREFSNRFYQTAMPLIEKYVTSFRNLISTYYEYTTLVPEAEKIEFQRLQNNLMNKLDILENKEKKLFPQLTVTTTQKWKKELESIFEGYEQNIILIIDLQKQRAIPIKEKTLKQLERDQKQMFLNLDKQTTEYSKFLRNTVTLSPNSLKIQAQENNKKLFKEKTHTIVLTLLRQWKEIVAAKFLKIKEAQNLTAAENMINEEIQALYSYCSKKLKLIYHADKLNVYLDVDSAKEFSSELGKIHQAIIAAWQSVNSSMHSEVNPEIMNYFKQMAEQRKEGQEFIHGVNALAKKNAELDEKLGVLVTEFAQCKKEQEERKKEQRENVQKTAELEIGINIADHDIKKFSNNTEILENKIQKMEAKLEEVVQILHEERFAYEVSQDTSKSASGFATKEKYLNNQPARQYNPTFNKVVSSDVQDGEIEHDPSINQDAEIFSKPSPTTPIVH